MNDIDTFMLGRSTAGGAGGSGGGANVTMAENPTGGVDITVENQKQ